MSKTTGTLHINTKGNLEATGWEVELNGVDISYCVKRLQIDSQAGEVPIITLTVIAEMQPPIVLEGYIQVNKE